MASSLMSSKSFLTFLATLSVNLDILLNAVLKDFRMLSPLCLFDLFAESNIKQVNKTIDSTVKNDGGGGGGFQYKTILLLGIPSQNHDLLTK